MTGISPLMLADNYWETLQINDQDLEFLYNHLLDLEMPLTPQELLHALVNERIQLAKNQLASKHYSSNAEIFLPKGQYDIGSQLIFPAMEWKMGTVIDKRTGINPEYEPFEIIKVSFENHENREFGSRIENHILNNPIPVNMDDPLLDNSYVIKNYGKMLLARLLEMLESNPDLVQIAGRWFPRALLVDINQGHLNLAEALLEEVDGGPLQTPQIIKVIDLSTDVNPKLTEFSLNLALQEDPRFDEIGSSGDIFWYLHRLEPVEVQSQHKMLQYFPIEYDHSSIEEYLSAFDSQNFDELEKTSISEEDEVNEVTVTLIYPHWRAGTIPLTNRLARLFPTAYESPRVLFSFTDINNRSEFSGWVVRPHKYVFGLKEWYEANNLFPGCQFTLQRGDPGEIRILLGKKHSTREWVRTLLVGADGGLVYAMLKQQVFANFDERMVISITDTTKLDELWEQSNAPKNNLDTIIRNSIIQLAKLSPQGHVHAQEIYSAVNLSRRCPPSAVLHVLFSRPWSVHLGDLYFRYQTDASV